MPEQMTSRTTRDAPELLVPFDGSAGAEKVLRRACQAALRDGDRLAVLCVVKMPPDDEEAWADPNLDDTALAALVRAQAICRAEEVVGVFKLNHRRNLADAIVEEARDSGAVLICMSLDEYEAHEVDETALMSETVQAVLAAAPCSVLLDAPASEPLPASTEHAS